MSDTSGYTNRPEERTKTSKIFSSSASHFSSQHFGLFVSETVSEMFH